MKIAIIGSRSIFVSIAEVAENLRLAGVRLTDISGIISGDAVGADAVAPFFAEYIGVPCRIIPPNYKLFGFKAPILRNRDIVESSDFVLAFWDRKSKGTESALEFAKNAKVPFFIVSKENLFLQKLF